MTTNVWVEQVTSVGLILLFSTYIQQYRIGRLQTDLQTLCSLQKWFDYKLQWNPQEYGGIEMLYVPSENIWLPDIVLYNK